MDTRISILTPLRQTYSVDDTARILGVGRNSAYSACKSGDVRTIRIGGRILVPKAEVDRLLLGTS